MRSNRRVLTHCEGRCSEVAERGTCHRPSKQFPCRRRRRTIITRFCWQAGADELRARHRHPLLHLAARVGVAATRRDRAGSLLHGVLSGLRLLNAPGRAVPADLGPDLEPGPGPSARPQHSTGRQPHSLSSRDHADAQRICESRTPSFCARCRPGRRLRWRRLRPFTGHTCRSWERGQCRWAGRRSAASRSSRTVSTGDR